MQNRTTQTTRQGKTSLKNMSLVLVLFMLTSAAAWILKINSEADHARSSRRDAAEGQIDSFTRVIEMFYLDTGRYPTEDEGLQALVENPDIAGWNGPYIKKARIPKDPWGNTYIYRLMPDNTYIIGSAGKDKVMGNNDDVRHRSLNAERKSAMDKNSRSFSTIGLLVTAGGKV